MPKFWRNNSKAATLSMQSSRAVGRTLAYPVAKLLAKAEGNRVVPAHDYIKVPSNSPAMQQKDARRKELVGTLVHDSAVDGQAKNPEKNRRVMRARRHRFSRLLRTKATNRYIAGRQLVW